MKKIAHLLSYFFFAYTLYSTALFSSPHCPMPTIDAVDNPIIPWIDATNYNEQRGGKRNKLSQFVWIVSQFKLIQCYILWARGCLLFRAKRTCMKMLTQLWRQFQEWSRDWPLGAEAFFLIHLAYGLNCLWSWRYGKSASSVRIIHIFIPSLLLNHSNWRLETKWQNSKLLCPMYKST